MRRSFLNAVRWGRLLRNFFVAVIPLFAAAHIGFCDLGSGYKSLTELSAEQINLLDGRQTGVIDPSTGAFYPLGAGLHQIIEKLKMLQPSLKIRIVGMEVFVGIVSISSASAELQGADVIYDFDCSQSSVCLLQGLRVQGSNGSPQELDGMSAALTLSASLSAKNPEAVDNEPNFISINGKVVPNPKKHRNEPS